MGPIQVLVLGFRGAEWTGAVQSAFQRAQGEGVIRVVDALVVTKQLGGAVDVVEFNEIDGLRDQAAAMVAAGYLGLIAPEDIDEVGTLLEPGDAAAILVIEHLWALGIQQEVTSAGGSLLSSVFIPREVIDEAEAALLANEGS